MHRFRSLIAGLTLLLTVLPSGQACTTFRAVADGRAFVGRNLDWLMGGGLIVVNPRQLQKTAIPFNPNTPPEERATWRSQYGSVTFSMLGPEYPSSGMNEAGLVVNEMTLDESVYPDKDSRPEVTPLQWIQYQLDNCATIDEVLATDTQIRISNETPSRHHYLICDKTGRTVTIDFVNGRRVVHEGETLPHAVLTNDTYDASAACLDNYQGFGGSAPIPEGRDSLERFARASGILLQFEEKAREKTPVQTAFDLLANVAQGKATVWSIVYDVQDRVIHYRTNEHTQTRFVDAKTLDYTCSTTRRVQTIENGSKGMINARFEDGAEEIIRGQITRVLGNPDFQDGYGDQTALVDLVLKGLGAYTCTE